MASQSANVCPVPLSFKQKLTATVRQLDQSRLQERYQGVDVVPIGEAALRTPIRVTGEVQENRVVPRAGTPSLEVTFDDGTGRAVAVFTGRRRIAGLSLGRGVLVEGVMRIERGRSILLNPAYTLL